jgi:hypothetical protein
MKNNMNTQNKIIIGIAAAAIIAVALFGAINISGKNKISENKGPGLYDKFAQCLTDKGATMYGAAWCPHCQEQKAVFGDSFKLVKYVECPDNTQLCIDKGIQGYPTWLIGTSTRFEGFDGNNTMKNLSGATGCPLP